MPTQTTTSAAFPWRPDVSVFAAADAVPDALILQCSTVAGSISGDEPSLRVAYVDDAAADFVAQASPIPEADSDLAEVTVYTSKVSQLVRLSNELYAQAGTAQQLSQSVSRALVKRADQAFISEADPSPNNAPSAGLLNIAGTVAGDQVSGSLDALVDLVAQLQANGSTPTHIVIDPLGWSELRKLKFGTG